jgi:hypothetical protein
MSVSYMQKLIYIKTKIVKTFFREFRVEKCMLGRQVPAGWLEGRPGDDAPGLLEQATSRR